MYMYMVSFFFFFENVYGFLLNFHINFQVNKDEVGVLFHKKKRKRKRKKEKKWVSSPLTPGKYRSNDVRKDEEALQTPYVTVWIQIISASMFLELCFSLFFFFFFSAATFLELRFSHFFFFFFLFSRNN